MTAKKIKFKDIDVIEDVKKFVSIAMNCDCDVDLVSGRYVVDAKSIMGLFSLDLSSELVLMIHTDDETVSSKFAEFIVA
jgi:phosphotransferase system HPr-like phosphotransfer protein